MDLSAVVAGVTYRLTNQYTIPEQSGSVSQATFNIQKKDNPPPIELSSFDVYNVATLVYSGILQVIGTPEYSSGYESQIYPCTVSSLNCILNNRLVSESYVDKLTHEIVDDLFDKYLLEEGLTKGTITTFTRSYEKYVANRMKLFDVLNELGDAVGAIPVITYDRVFHFIDSSNFTARTPPTHITGLKKNSDATALRTVQFLSGASEDTTLQTKSFAWTAGQTEIVLAYQVSNVIGITINGTPAGVGIQGLDSGDASKSFLWKYSLTNVALNASATVKPVAGDTVVIAYYGYYAIEVESTNETLRGQIAALNGTSGKIESVNVDQTITSTIDGEQAAADLLSTNGTVAEELDLVCHDMTASQLLSEWTLSYPELFIGGKYVVVERVITDAGNQFRIAVKMRNRGFVVRYGTIYNKNQKTLNNLTIRPDDLVQKFGATADSVSATEDWILTNGGLICYPGVEAGEIFADQNLGDFYPT